MQRIESTKTGVWANFRRFPLLYGLAVALFWALLGTLGVGLYAHTALPSESTQSIALYATHCIAIFFGAIAASRSARIHGWYYGGVTGLLYSILMLGISLIAVDSFSLNAAGLLRALILTAVGAFSGMIGVSTTNGASDESS